MVIRGRIHNGLVALGSGISLPEGMEVAVVVPTEPAAAAGRMTDEQRRALHEVRKEIESLPNESPGDTFSGADHDCVLYRGTLMVFDELGIKTAVALDAHFRQFGILVVP